MALRWKAVNMSNKPRMIGNFAKLRKALETLMDIVDAWKDHLPPVIQDGELAKAMKKAETAIAAPPRNCDVYTADELKVIFNRGLVLKLPSADEHEKNLVTITAMGVIDTLFETTKEGGAK